MCLGFHFISTVKDVEYGCIDNLSVSWDSWSISSCEQRQNWPRFEWATLYNKLMLPYENLVLWLN